MFHSDHAFTNYYPLVNEGLAVCSRRNMLKAGLAGIAGLSLPGSAEDASGSSRQQPSDES